MPFSGMLSRYVPETLGNLDMAVTSLYVSRYELKVLLEHLQATLADFLCSHRGWRHGS